MTIHETLETAITDALASLGIAGVDFILDHPRELSHGDFATNAALIVGKQTGESPKEIADKLVRYIVQNKPEEVERIEVAGVGFINFYLSREFFRQGVAAVDDHTGKSTELAGQKVMVEYTDPNPFKQFHIGHLMSNAVGESLSRLIEAGGAEVRRANYQGDVGLHVAKAVWGKQHNPEASWGEAYALGAGAYDAHSEEIDALNKTIYERSDEAVNALYDEGKRETLTEFEEMYEALGTAFDEYFFESESGPYGKSVVEEHSDVFERGDGGAVVFHAETRDPALHTRVFINAVGLPTYEAKELGLAKLKYDRFPYDHSVVVTANEVDIYFRVVLTAMREIFPELAEKTEHMSHGIMKLPSGKMSSRTGNVVTAEFLIGEVKKAALEKMEEKDDVVAEQVAVGALKYTILKQAIGNDIIFARERALSFEGDSGPYLQYTHARALSVLEKASAAGLSPDASAGVPDEVTNIERLLYRFPEVVVSAREARAPHTVATFLTELAGAFNTFYAEQKIIDEENPHTPYYLALTKALAHTIKNGLWLLGIQVPEKM